MRWTREGGGSGWEARVSLWVYPLLDVFLIFFRGLKKQMEATDVPTPSRSPPKPSPPLGARKTGSTPLAFAALHNNVACLELPLVSMNVPSPGR